MDKVDDRLPILQLDRGAKDKTQNFYKMQEQLT